MPPSISFEKVNLVNLDAGVLPHSAPRAKSRRDRSGSGARSVVTRVEIGPLPARDRSHSVPRSVVLPVRGCGVSKHLGQVACFRCASPPVGWFSGLGSDESGHAVSGRLRRHPHVPGEVDSAHSRALGVGGNRGIMRNSYLSSGNGPAPMCTDPLTAHGSPTTIRDDRQKSASFQQEPAPALRRSRSPMCNIETTDTRQAHSLRPALRSVRFGPANSTSRRARRARGRKLHAAHLRTAGEQQARGTGPISTRKWTDLGEGGGWGKVSRRREGEARGVHRSADTAVARPVVAGFVPRS